MSAAVDPIDPEFNADKDCYGFTVKN